ncbi:YndM family protein [Lederbergia citri]|uniref:YndM family protein n=1 Tax=Lederbergia citri TaxID=2833580 RepID=A0A942TGV6_9BACI|nr:YndM family protein [Lederbergia citri]MBS4197816.1 YndM family protein [Lederbergia citri]
MDHVKALAIKFISSLALLYIILGMLYGMTFGNVFLITLVLGVVSYIIGDLIILPRTNNTVASIADFGIVLIIIWILSAAPTDFNNLFTMSLKASIAVTLFEYVFHRYVENNVVSKKTTEDYPRNMQYQTESSEEFTPNGGIENQKNK